MEGLLLVVLHHVGLCCMALCCAHHHAPWGCWLVLEVVVAGCHLLPIVALPLLCRIVIVCRIGLLSFPSLCCRHSHHSHFPILTTLIVPCFHPMSSCSWQWLGVLCGGSCPWPPHRHVIIRTLLIRSPGTLQLHPVPRQCPHIPILQGGGQSGCTQLLSS